MVEKQTSPHQPIAIADSLNSSRQSELYWLVHDYFQRLGPDGKLAVDEKGLPANEPYQTYPRENAEDYARNEDPDNVAHNYPTFHEFGNFSHPTKVLERWREFRAGKGEVAVRLGTTLCEQVQNYFEQQIDGLQKADLLEIAIVFHDIAKHISPLYPPDPRWPGMLRNHWRHEDRGAEFLRTYYPVQELLLIEYKLTPTQLDYIADCVEHHFTLDHVRRLRVENHQPYDFAYTQSEECRQNCTTVIELHPHMAIEIGLWFLIDSAGKTTELYFADTAEEYALYLARLKERVADGSVDARLEKALSQQSLNFQVGKNYLQNPNLQVLLNPS